MKLITFLVLYLAFSQISLNICGTLSRNHRYRNTRRRSTRTGQANNKWYQLFVGLLFGLAGEAHDMSALNECVPDKWKIVDSSPAPKNGDAPPQKSIFMEIINAVGTVITFVCAWKKKIIKLLTKKIRKLLRRNRYRMFVETRVANLRKVKWGWDSIGNFFSNVANTVENTAEKVVNTAEKVVNTVESGAVDIAEGHYLQAFKKIKGMALSVEDWAHKKWDEIKSLANGIVSKLKFVYSNAVNTVKRFLSSSLVETLKKIFECAMTLKSLILGLTDVIVGVQDKMELLASIAAQDYAAIAELIVDLICNFSDLVEAFTYLIDGIHESDTIKQYSLIGKFIGTAIRAIVSRKLKYLKK